jgi:hypothetical protein
VSRWTFIAQRATTREFLHWDLPLELDSLEWELNGPGALTATIAPDVGGLRDESGRLVLEEWGTIIYAESGGLIRWAGLVVSCSFQGESWSLECAGFSTYPHALTYRGEFVRIGVDPAEAFRHIWEHLQSFPDSNLGVRVTGDYTPIRLGKAAWTETVDGKVTEHEAEPYSLVWWESTNCGSELDDLTKTAPFDWAEAHRWDDDREDVIHEIQVGYPRLGRRREDLVFVQGDNVTNVVTVESNGDTFANAILGLGAGEGRAMLRRETAVRDGRLRRDHVYADKAVTDARRMDALIAAELNARKAALRVTSFTVIDHDNAPLGSWQLGDDVLLRFEVPWLGEVEMWARITAWALTGEYTATLTVSRSDFFRYGG